MYTPGAYRNVHINVFFSTRLTKAIHAALSSLSTWLLSNPLSKDLSMFKKSELSTSLDQNATFCRYTVLWAHHYGCIVSWEGDDILPWNVLLCQNVIKELNWCACQLKFLLSHQFLAMHWWSCLHLHQRNKQLRDSSVPGHLGPNSRWLIKKRGILCTIAAVKMKSKDLKFTYSTTHHKWVIHHKTFCSFIKKIVIEIINRYIMVWEVLVESVGSEVISIVLNFEGCSPEENSTMEVTEGP